MREVGLSFAAILLAGTLCGQAFLGLHASQHLYLLDDSEAPGESWLRCHLMTGLLILHLNLLTAPITSKVWRVWRKIRKAETERLSLWDRPAIRLTLLQLTLAVSLFALHLGFVAREESSSRLISLSGGQSCLDGAGDGVHCTT